jgi:hypothetical protein
MRSTLGVLLAVALLFVVAPAGAHAAVGVTISADPLEDRAITFVGTGDVAARKLYAKLRPAGSACAPVYNGETGTDVFFSDPIGTQEVKTIADPGAYVICAYLQEYSSDNVAASAATVPLTVRANNATISVVVPAVANPGVGVPVAFVGTTELGRELYAKTKPLGAGACGQSRGADPSSDTIANGLPASAAFAIPRLTGSFNSPGQQLVCAWLQEGYGDVLAEAVGSAVINVVAPLPLMTDLDVSPLSFAARRIGPAITSNYPNTSVSYRLNTNAEVRFTVKARRAGRRVGASCRKPTRALRNRASCARYVKVRGSFSHSGTPGTNYLRFSGRLSGRSLPLGRYRLYAEPRNSTGVGRTLKQSFRIIRR